MSIRVRTVGREDGFRQSLWIGFGLCEWEWVWFVEIVGGRDRDQTETNVLQNYNLHSTVYIKEEPERENAPTGEVLSFSRDWTPTQGSGNPFGQPLGLHIVPWCINRHTSKYRSYTRMARLTAGDHRALNASGGRIRALSQQWENVTHLTYSSVRIRYVL
jgi:hypothetical protein